MKTNNSTYQKRGKATGSGLNSIKRLVLLMMAVGASIVGLLLWVIIRPLLRGVGWVISILSALAVIFWLLTL